MKLEEVGQLLLVVMPGYVAASSSGIQFQVQ